MSDHEEHPMTKTLPEKFTIQDDFPPVSYEQWRALAEESLQGAPFDRKLVTHTYEGIDIQPIYSRRDQLAAADPLGFPGFAPFVRGSRPLGAVKSGWDLRQEHAHPDLTVTNRAILDDLHGGVTSVLLRLDAAARRGLDPDHPVAVSSAGQDGIMAYCLEDLDAALANVHTDLVGIALESGAAFLPGAAMLVALWNRRGTALEQARGAFNSDPLAVLAREGELPVSLEAAWQLLADLARWTSAHCPRVTSVGVDTSPYHEAGATAAQDVAFALATAVEYLRVMTSAGLSTDAAAAQILFRVGLGTHHFLAIGKLRAARRLWSRVIEVCGGSRQAGAMQIHAKTSLRVLTQRDPYVNLLRNTVAVFAAGVGGATTISSAPFDSALGVPDEVSRRIARNTLLVLQEEAHLHRVIDPAGGSWFLDQLTEQLADKAWQTFQAIEKQGGMGAALQNGWIANQIDAAYAPRAADIARRKAGITGVSEFPDVHEPPVVRTPPNPADLRPAVTKRIAALRTDVEVLSTLSKAHDRTAAAVQAANASATVGQLAQALGFRAEPVASVVPLAPRSFAEPFEELRDASDVWHARHGRRPTVFLANMGPVAHHTARANYAKNFFEAGGFDVLGSDGFTDAEAAAAAFADSGATIAVICSSDKLYAEVVPPLAACLKGAGARSVVLAGHPADNEAAWRKAGVDRFIFVKCDVVQTLREMLREEGVI